MRERPQRPGSRSTMTELEKFTSDNDGGLLGLPETDNELDVSDKQWLPNPRIVCCSVEEDIVICYFLELD